MRRRGVADDAWCAGTKQRMSDPDTCSATALAKGHTTTMAINTTTETTTTARPTTEEVRRQIQAQLKAAQGGEAPADAQALETRTSKARSFNCCGRGACSPEELAASQLERRVSKGLRAP
jgi:hypothetical protein